MGIVGIVSTRRMGIIIKDEPKHFSWFYDLNCFFYEFPWRFVGCHDHQEAVDPALQNLTIQKGNERRRIYNYILIIVECFLQEFPETLGLQYFVGSSNGLPGRQEIQIKSGTTSHRISQGKIRIRDYTYHIGTVRIVQPEEP